MIELLANPPYGADGHKRASDPTDRSIWWPVSLQP